MTAEKKPMPRCTPEEAGVPSAAVESYLKALESQKLALHSLMMIRHGKIIFEAYWKPMDETFRHRLYSCSKSFVSCAVGLLIEKGLLRLDDPAISFFPDKAPKDPHPWMAQMTIRDLLRMSTCYERGASYKPSDPDWEATFFTDEVSHMPGAVFSYCTTATTMLCMIIKRVSGKEFTQVLRPAFDEIGVSDELYCIETPCGHEWGGSGVMATTREFAKFANLVMHYGEHEGRQLLPRDYLVEATSKQIDNSVDHACVDEGMGYGYQFWITRNGGFLFNGMGCQFALCLPKEDFILVTNGYEELNKKATGEIFNAFWREIYPCLAGDEPLPANGAAHEALLNRAAALELLRPDGEVTSPTAARVNGATYAMAENQMGIRSLRFEFNGDGGVMRWETARGAHALPFGFGKQIACEFPETHYHGRRIGAPLGRGLNCQVSAAWQREDELMIYCHVVDMHLAQLRVAVAFKGDTVTLRTAKHAEFILQEYAGFASGRLAP
ncbi:MAG: beta-lactamase family protein [Clostridia bacterium]|nr:beta-lactamase family protein [Clostridia bacterium]